jgi:hypothetical protein
MADLRLCLSLSGGASLGAIALGVIGPVEVRDGGLLASAVGRPQSTVLGEDAYPTFVEKAAARGDLGVADLAHS